MEHELELSRSPLARREAGVHGNPWADLDEEMDGQLTGTTIFMKSQSRPWNMSVHADEVLIETRKQR